VVAFAHLCKVVWHFFFLGGGGGSVGNIAIGLGWTNKRKTPYDCGQGLMGPEAWKPARVIHSLQLDAQVCVFVDLAGRLLQELEPDWR